MPGALILGASGHVGNAVVRDLISRGWDVCATSRQKAPASNLLKLTTRYLSGCPGNVDDFADWFTGYDLVIDAASPYPLNMFDFTGNSLTPMERATQRTEQLVQAAARTSSTLCCISSFTTVIKAQSDTPTSLLGGFARTMHPYFGVKRAVERVVLSAAERGQDCFLLNPTLCLGPWDLKDRELTLLPPLATGDLPVTTEHTINVVDVRDVARMLHAAYEQKFFGRRLLCSGHNLALSDLAQTVAEQAQSRPPLTQVSTALSTAGAMWGELILAGIAKNSPLPALGMMLISEHQHLEISKAQRALGISPLALQNTIADSLTWYTQIGYC